MKKYVALLGWKGFFTNPPVLPIGYCEDKLDKKSLISYILR